MTFASFEFCSHEGLCLWKEFPHLISLLGEGAGLAIAGARAGAGVDTEGQEGQGRRGMWSEAGLRELAQPTPCCLHSHPCLGPPMEAQS